MTPLSEPITVTITADPGPFEAAMRRVIAALNRRQASIARWHALYDHHERHHPRPLAPGMVTWPARRRRRRRTR